MDTVMSGVVRDFGQVVAQGIPAILAGQRDDGAIVVGSRPTCFPQQAILPMAFCWAGLDPDGAYRGDPDLLDAIRRLGDHLAANYDERGRYSYDSRGTPVTQIDQRLTYAWVEALRIVREHGADLPYEVWQEKIVAACRSLIEHRIDGLRPVREFVGHVTGTSMNHIALYLSTIYRSGMVFDDAALREAVLAFARKFADAQHPDGYWGEHNDIRHIGGPAMGYNYLTHCGMALFAEWTGEAPFLRAVERATRFHGNACYPDGAVVDVFDGRQRNIGRFARPWGLFGFSHSAEGRAVALAHFATWRDGYDPAEPDPEHLARHVENALYWHDGPVGVAPFARPGHAYRLTLPGLLRRQGPWTAAVAALPAENAFDPGYRDIPYALDRQKLVSLHHVDLGLLIDGAHAKNQPDNSSFCAVCPYTIDHLPLGGEVHEIDGGVAVDAMYRTFRARIEARMLDGRRFELRYRADFVAHAGPITAACTLPRRKEEVLRTAAGTECRMVEDAEWSLAPEQHGGAVVLGGVRFGSPQPFTVSWPYRPFNSYAADRRSAPSAWLPRLAFELTRDRPQAVLTVDIVG